ncbi:hypothetical protein DFA_05117 [Cavenderia fasciculata]|uniref:Transmembrane protein n=1 Tax=Cavenderia fasciculata TaxID=261658 RepID=F4PND4_CACFS|nr:uncharacterized protein DFA_05117 [Cavenderia fasciculata]EGG22987.1 hypothetical protein DFA_05117 [Cavenderia fasciculata]|eukprot:XP_004360838.1 hypothetical protein DFA_05117 [Cavenderia fasciculata]
MTSISSSSSNNLKIVQDSIIFSRSYHLHMSNHFASHFDQMATLEDQLKTLHRWNLIYLCILFVVYIYRYDKDNTHPVTALIQLLFTKSPDGTENDKCLFHHLSYETKKHIHELLLNHIKQLRKFNNHEIELIQLIYQDRPTN